MKTTTFIDGAGKSQTTWLDGNTIRTCATESYNHIYKQAVKDLDEDPEHKKSQEQEEKEKKVDDIAKAEEEEKKQKVLDELKNALRKLTSEELDEEKDKLTDEIAQLRAQLENPDKEDEEKQSKQAEFIAVNTDHLAGTDGDAVAESLVALQNQRLRKKKSRHDHDQLYSVLTLDQNYHESERGDALLQRMGSVD